MLVIYNAQNGSMIKSSLKSHCGIADITHDGKHTSTNDEAGNMKYALSV